MPSTDVYFFKEEEGSVPVLDWLTELRSRNELAASVSALHFATRRLIILPADTPKS